MIAASSRAEFSLKRLSFFTEPALFRRKKQGLKISPKPLFIIRGVPKWTCRLSVTPAGGEQCDFVGIFQYTVHKDGFSYR